MPINDGALLHAAAVSYERFRPERTVTLLALSVTSTYHVGSNIFPVNKGMLLGKRQERLETIFIRLTSGLVF